jgi:ferrochelatase
MKAKLAEMPERTKVLFTAHSLPQRIIDAGDPYPEELRATAELVAEKVGLDRWSQWSIAWQSAGRTPEPWIGPDILAVIDQMATTRESDEPVDGVLVCACGFVADHLEVLYDLDLEASQHAAKFGIAFARTECVNDNASVMAALAKRVVTA